MIRSSIISRHEACLQCVRLAAGPRPRNHEPTGNGRYPYSLYEGFSNNQPLQDSSPVIPVGRPDVHACSIVAIEEKQR